MSDTAYYQYTLAQLELDRQNDRPRVYHESVGDPPPDPRTYSTTCEFHDRCRDALGIPRELRCGYHGLRLEDGRPAWTGCLQWQDGRLCDGR